MERSTLHGLDIVIRERRLHHLTLGRDADEPEMRGQTAGGVESYSMTAASVVTEIRRIVGSSAEFVRYARASDNAHARERFHV